MAPRANWKGYLKLSLVSCPIALYPATSSSTRVSFHRINKQTGNRLKQQNVDAETGDVVDREGTGKGYAVGKHELIEVTDEELEQIKVESTHTIDIDSFVKRAEVDERYLDAPYYLAPTEKVGEEPFIVIREAIRATNMAAVGRVVIARRERVIMLEPFDKGLLGFTLRYPYELRDAKPYFEEIPDLAMPAEMLDLAKHIVRTKSAPFDPAAWHDRYEEAVVDLLKKKQAGRPVAAETPERPAARVINLMDALRKSIESEGKPPAGREPARRAAAPAKKPPAKSTSRGGRRS